MAYIYRNAEGAIIASSANQKLGEQWAFIEDKDAAYLAYLEACMAESMPFRESDIQFARVLEDLVSILISRNLIQFTDFPEAAQRRMNQRQSMRKNTQLSNLIDEQLDKIFS